MPFSIRLHIVSLAVSAAALLAGCVDTVEPSASVSYWTGRGTVAYTKGLSLTDTGEVRSVNLDGTSDTRLLLGGLPCAPAQGTVAVTANSAYGRWSLSIASLDGGNRRELASAIGQQITAVTLSTDASLVAYVISPFTGTGSDTTKLFLATADGASNTLIAKDVVNSAYPAFSPDGTRLAAYTGRDRSSVTVFDLLGGTSRVVATNARPSSIENIEWAPAGERIVYVGAAGSGRALFSVKADGTDQTNLTPDGAGDDRWPAISPDGNSIAFIRDGELWTMNSDGSGRRRLASGAAAQFRIAMFPQWAPECPMILFTSIAANPARGLLQVVDVESGRVSVLATDAARGFWLDCGPPNSAAGLRPRSRADAAHEVSGRTVNLERR